MKLNGNNNNNETKICHWMLYLTPMAFFTGMYAIHCRLWILMIAEWSLVASSIYYWSHHIDDWRRRLDMIVVQLSLYTHLYYSLYHSSYYSLSLYTFGMGSYIIGVFYNSYIAHAFVWVFGCTANIVLTNGLCE
jgi:hypothetical protein